MTAPLNTEELQHLRELAQGPLAQPGAWKTLRLLRDNGGEIPFVPGKFSPEAGRMLVALCDANIISAHRPSEVIVTGRARFRLTDLGRRCLDYDEKMKGSAVKVDQGAVDMITVDEEPAQ